MSTIQHLADEENERCLEEGFISLTIVAEDFSSNEEEDAGNPRVIPDSSLPRSHSEEVAGYSNVRKRMDEQDLSETSQDSIPQEVNSTKGSNTISHMLQMMKERLNLSNPGSRNHSLSNSWLSFNSSCTDFEESLDELNTSSESGFEHFYRHYRSDEIQEEIKLVKTHHQDGVYVVPSFKSIEMWFGVMFIRDGPYKDGIFHFTIFFPDEFPDARPMLKFKSNIFHPQIIPKKGTLNLNPVYLKSKQARVRTWQLIQYARSCFYHLNVNNASNLEAAQIFKTDLKKFKARCRSSVLDSLLVYEEQRTAIDYQSENPFRCSIDDDLCSAIKNAMLSTNVRGNDEREGVLGWAKSQLGKVLNNINTYASNNNSEDKARLSKNNN